MRTHFIFELRSSQRSFWLHLRAIAIVIERGALRISTLDKSFGFGKQSRMSGALARFFRSTSRPLKSCQDVPFCVEKRGKDLFEISSPL